eukprot:m.88109 g.88109  ORF g.88109 m.88109 type:complete len:281 (-) comp9738_c0_seq2:7-849(-)
MATVWVALAATASVTTCGDKLLHDTGLAGSGMKLTALLNVSSLDECCGACHGNYHDECVGWTYGPTPGTADLQPHNCAIFAKLGATRSTIPNHVSAIVGGGPVPPPPPPPGPVGPVCRADIDCTPLTSPTWRCSGASIPPTPEDNCHLPGPGSRGNSTCRCGAPTCTTTGNATNLTATQYLMIGDSITQGMEGDLSQTLRGHGWELTHNPGNAASSNLGAHCLSDWLVAGNRPKWDVLSYNFGLHDVRSRTVHCDVFAVMESMCVCLHFSVVTTLRCHVC